MNDELTLQAVRTAQLPRLLLMPDLVDVLGVGPRTVRRYLARGEIPGARVGGRWVVPRDDLLAHLGRRAEMVPCADCTREISRAAGLLGSAGLVVCRACAARLRDAGGGA